MAIPRQISVRCSGQRTREQMNKTKGQLEAEICEAVIKFEKEYMGRGPLETKAYIIGDMVLVRLKNVLTQAEHKLAEATDRENGRELIKRIRIALHRTGAATVGIRRGRDHRRQNKEPAYGHQYGDRRAGDPFLLGRSRPLRPWSQRDMKSHFRIFLTRGIDCNMKKTPIGPRKTLGRTPRKGWGSESSLKV